MFPPSEGKWGGMKISGLFFSLSSNFVVYILTDEQGNCLVFKPYFYILN